MSQHMVWGTIWRNHLGRIRLIWRLGGLIVLCLSVYVIIELIEDLVIELPLPISAGFLSLILATCIFAFGIDRMKFRDMGLGLKERAAELGFGLGLGFVQYLGVYLANAILGTIFLIGVSWPGSLNPLLVGLTFFTLAAMAEEVFFRGYLLNHLSGHIFKNILISALFFAALHLEFSASRFIYLIVSGIAYGYMYLWSGSLWLPIGAHMAWNVTGNLSVLDTPIIQLVAMSNNYETVNSLAGMAVNIIGLFAVRWFLKRRGKACPWIAWLSPRLSPELVTKEEYNALVQKMSNENRLTA